MNPIGLILIGIGIIMFITGFKGSQHELVDVLKGQKSASGAAPKPKSAGAGGTTGINPATGTGTI